MSTLNVPHETFLLEFTVICGQFSRSDVQTWLFHNLRRIGSDSMCQESVSVAQILLHEGEAADDFMRSQAKDAKDQVE
jgi:hypothetical protein